MHLKKIILTQYKNYRQASLDLHPRLNIITGLNGAGKTNLLDAVYYLCFCKSYFQTPDVANILHSDVYFRLEGWFTQSEMPLQLDDSTDDSDGMSDDISGGKEGEAVPTEVVQATSQKTHIISAAFRKGGKKLFEKDRVPYSTLTEHIGFCPLLFIAPDDIQIIKGGSADRRKVMDSTLAQIDPTYLRSLVQYKRVLQQRNALLKSFAEKREVDSTLLEAYDVPLTQHGTYIHHLRKQLAKDLQIPFQQFYNELSSNREQVKLQYQSPLDTMSFEDLLLRNRDKDELLQRTTSGTHRDDWVFTLSDYPLKKMGSQGQQKTFLIALKLSLYYLLRKHKQVAPVLMLDDVFDKLDGERIEMLLKIVTQPGFGQVFITDTDAQRLKRILAKLKLDFQHFSIQEGGVS